MAFWTNFLQYAIIFVILAAVAGCGIFLGMKLRQRKDAKTAGNQEDK